MSGYDFTHSCGRCAATLFTVTGGSAAAWKADAAAGGHPAECPSCGSVFTQEDDGDPDGGVQPKDVSAPMVTSLNISSGPRTGGNAAFITGEALAVGNLVVKVGGKAAPMVDSRTETSARVVMPPATYQLNVAERCHKLTLTLTFGSLSVDEAITSTAGSTGTIRHIDGNQYMVAFVNLAELLEDMVGTSVIGGGSGGVATVTAASKPEFQVGESLNGLTSGSVGVVRTVVPLVVDSPSGGFSPNEVVSAPISGAFVKLGGSPAYSGLVDVIVENEYGQRASGGVLVGAYTYA